MAGYPKDKVTINNRAGSIAINVRNVLREVDDFQTVLDGLTDQNLLDLGFTQTELDDMQAAFAALAKLSRVARAGDTVPVADDFLFNARKLMGVN